MDIAFLLGRVLFGGFFIYSGIRHFQYLDMMAAFTGSKGVPQPRMAVIVSGLLILVGGFSILLGFHPVTGVILITAFLVPVTLLMHRYWNDTDMMTRINNEVNFLKNVALLGAAWMLLSIPRPWPMSLTW